MSCPSGFPPAEFARRAAALQSGMATAEIDALLLTTPADIAYASGFTTRFWESPTRPWFLILPAQAAPIAVIPAIGAALMAHTWVEDIRTWDAPAPEDDGVSLLAATLREAMPANGRLGVPLGHETHLRMPWSDFDRLRAEIAPRAVVDATPAVRRAREVKSAAEVERVRAACAAAGAAFDRVPEFAATGRPLDAVFRDFQRACLEEGADWVSYLAGGAGPGGYADVISPAASRPLQTGDVLMLDTGAVRAGYFCDYDRNYAVRRAEDDVRRAYDVLFAATEAGIEAARPGARACDVHAAIAAVIAAAGYDPGAGRLGHGLGLQLTEPPSLLPADRTPLRDGMVLTIEPGLQVSPGRLMVHEENIVLRAGGAEMLSPRAPASLPTLE